ncbi:MAG: glutathione S-transferase family protein [Halioglobus sp.]|nr:glutathione S-transferase family protein [Halioglobus sp.]
MLKLYGFPISHYYNMVKHTLLTKGVEFEEVRVLSGAGSDYLEKSPLGKIPCIETEHGFLSETSVILDYLETRYPQTPLSPADNWGKTKMKELMKISELYIESQGRPLIRASMELEQMEQAKIDEAASVMGKGFSAIAQLGQFKPYLMGEQMTLADIFLRYALVVIKGSAALPNLDTATFANIDIHDLVPGLAAWEKLMSESEISQRIDAIAVEELSKLMAMRPQQQE